MIAGEREEISGQADPDYAKLALHCVPLPKGGVNPKKGTGETKSEGKSRRVQLF